MPDIDSSQILPVVDKLDGALNAVRTKHPGYEIAVTGLSAIAARNSAGMIEKLNHGLTIEFGLVAVFIGLAFRSWVVMLACILPGIFPVVLSGFVLWLLGEGLQFASVVALTVSFGLGLSATIHFLNRLRLEDTPGTDPAVAVERATVLVGPALILTSVVLACGLVVTVFSDLPSLRLFGWLSRLRDGRGAGRRPVHPAPDRDVADQPAAEAQRHFGAGEAGGVDRRSMRPSSLSPQERGEVTRDQLRFVPENISRLRIANLIRKSDTARQRASLRWVGWVIR